MRRATEVGIPNTNTSKISIHALLAESDTPNDEGPSPVATFLSTLSLRRATRPPSKRQILVIISIHALLAESDAPDKNDGGPGGQFLSTLSLRRATTFIIYSIIDKCISIHALLAESDPQTMRAPAPSQHFYPRSPCGERPIFAVRPYDAPIFLSTLSLRRATSCKSVLCRPPSDFYPRSPCGERRFCGLTSLIYVLNFYPRSPCGERPRPLWLQSRLAAISIHALLAESDANHLTGMTVTSPKFLSTLSLRRATHYGWSWYDDFTISIHALLAESDTLRRRPNRHTLKFLSTLSLRRATAKVHKTVGHFCAYETNFMEIASSC